jgi:tetratricopeptide (TPR) repeat protein
MLILTVLAYLFAGLGAVTAVMVGFSLSPAHREQYSLLVLLPEEQTQLLIISTVCWVMAYGAKLGSELLRLKPQLQSIRVSGGQLSQKASRQCVESELAEAGTDLAREVWSHLDAAERHFAAKRYREAAGNFQRSIEILPTMSGYLNLGVSFMYLWEFHRAEASFLSGIQLARQEGNREFEGAFLNNLGNTYFREGKYDRALESYRSALKFYEQIGDSVAQATVFHNSGIVYHAQEKLEEALRP